MLYFFDNVPTAIIDGKLVPFQWPKDFPNLFKKCLLHVTPKAYVKAYASMYVFLEFKGNKVELFKDELVHPKTGMTPGKILMAKVHNGDNFMYWKSIYKNKKGFYITASTGRIPITEKDIDTLIKQPWLCP